MEAGLSWSRTLYLVRCPWKRLIVQDEVPYLLPPHLGTASPPLIGSPPK